MVYTNTSYQREPSHARKTSSSSTSSSNSDVHSASEGAEEKSRLFAASLKDTSYQNKSRPISSPSDICQAITAFNSKQPHHEQATSLANIAQVSIVMKQNHAKIICDFINAQEDFNKTKYPPFLQNDLSQEKNITISHLEELNFIEELSHNKKETKVKILIKETKVLLLKKIEDQLKIILEKQISHKSAEEKKQNKFMSGLKYMGFVFVTIMGTIIGGVSSFLGMQGLLKVIFVGITAPVSLGVGLILTVVDSLLFLSFEVGMLKAAMNIDHRSDMKKCLDLDEIEMSHINSIQTLLPQAANCANKTQLENYNLIRKACNTSIATIKNSYKEEIKENKIQKFFRHAVTAVGSVLVVAGTYYMMTSLIVFLSTLFLVSNPVGWAIIGVGLLTSLAFFLSMRGKAVVNMFIPEIAQFKDLKIKLEKVEKHNIELLNTKTLNEEKEHLRKENKRLRKENKLLKHTIRNRIGVRRRHYLANKNNIKMG